MHRFLIFFFAAFMVFSSCHHIGDTHRQENKIFHALMSNEMGDFYFGLYKDSTYQICASGRIAQDCFSGKYDLKGDTLVLFNLNPEVNLKYDHLLIMRYGEVDSNYWKEKYPNSSSSWRTLKLSDSTKGLGDVYQINDYNQILRDSNESRFVITIDSLKYYR
ncbi:MAG: hypothetical protein E6H09_06890 [Bacteroidetes bacterium]|jgi:hypothetical protein|nr:MAG: hypothetical protein E6H09_06890 [Bacteroidota bacterium]